MKVVSHTGGGNQIVGKTMNVVTVRILSMDGVSYRTSSVVCERLVSLWDLQYVLRTFFCDLVSRRSP